MYIIILFFIFIIYKLMKENDAKRISLEYEHDDEIKKLQEKIDYLSDDNELFYKNAWKYDVMRYELEMNYLSLKHNEPLISYELKSKDGIEKAVEVHKYLIQMREKTNDTFEYKNIILEK